MRAIVRHTRLALGAPDLLMKTGPVDPVPKVAWRTLALVAVVHALVLGVLLLLSQAGIL